LHFVRGTLVAAITLLLVNLAYSAKAEGRTRVLCLSAYDDEFFYFAASVQKPNLVGRNVKIFSDPIADDAVAVFLQTEDSPQMTKRTDKSVELAVSAAGGSQLYRGTGAVPLKDYSDLLKGPGGIPIPFKYRTTTTGRLNAPGDAKTGYVVEMAIPWIEFGGPPKTGQRMKMNVVAFSAVQSSDGEVADLAAIAAAARAHGALTVVDATQAAGWLPLAAGRFDAVVVSGYKWLLSPRGTAYLSLSEALLDRDARHTQVG